MCLEFFHATMDQRLGLLLNIFQFAKWAELQMYFDKNDEVVNYLTSDWRWHGVIENGLCAMWGQELSFGLFGAHVKNYTLISAY